MYRVIIFIALCLAVTGCATNHPQSVPDIDSKRHYTVKEEDNFHSIAFAFEITVSQLKQANPWLNTANIAAGMRLTIPSARSETPSVVVPQPGRFIWPLKQLDVSSDFGFRRGGLHTGIDLRASRGTQIYAAAAGEVVFSGRQNGYGHMVILDHGNDLQTVYSHNKHNLVYEGQQVQQGQLIASVGRSGRASGYHLHFEIRRDGKAVNPSNYLAR
jgi:murein DD-endopeptidase MepM/ murein hydrolase activator NlpD